MKKGFKSWSTLKKFLMSLAATTVSIILTFGTTAIIDRKKQRAEKREMVMMIMYDMRESLNEIEQCDKEISAFFDLQVDIVAHPEEFYRKYEQFYIHIPILTYTTTTENIFKSNIETVSTIGNILFVETVSSFYDKRGRFKTEVLDPFQKQAGEAIRDYGSLADFNSSSFPYFSRLSFLSMQQDFEQCKIMMKVRDEELDVFSQERENLQQLVKGETVPEEIGTVIQEKKQRDIQLEKAREEGNKSLK